MIQLTHSPYQYRFLTRMIVEAATPIAIGSGEQSILTDRLVLRDINHLPYLPGTTIAGVLLHAMREVDTSIADQYFGSQTQGSNLLFSEGRLVGPDGVVIDGISEMQEEDEFFNLMREMPIRQHVRINSRGTTDKHGKFDEEIVPRGARFCFEIELLASSAQEIQVLQRVIDLISSCRFRLGGGTRNGFGELEVIHCYMADIDLSNRDQQLLYLEKSSRLDNSGSWAGWTPRNLTKASNSGYDHYQIILHPTDFYFFGAGIGDKDVDDAPLHESFIKWDQNDKAHVVAHSSKVMPATSFKGVLSHRVAYHYNKHTQAYVGSGKEAVGDQNVAVAALFGAEGDAQTREGRKRGCVLFSDIIQQSHDDVQAKIFNHVTINQFTGGAKAGNLYDEKTIYAPQEEFVINMYVPQAGLDDTVIQALQSSIHDICLGMLPLGGLSNRGHGMFEGSYSINNKAIEL